MYQIKKFLSFLKVAWIEEIKLPSDPDYTPKRVNAQDISDTIEYFRFKEHFKRHRALILLGYTSGFRAEELFRNDVDLCHYNSQSEEDLKRIYDKIMLGKIF